MVRRSMTSASMPSSASFSAALSARSTISEKAVMVTWPPSRRILALPIGSDEVVELGHVEALAVEHLVLEEHDRVGIADRGLEQALGVGRAVGGHDLQARAVGVPGAVFLAVLGADAGGGAVGAAEHDRAAQLAAGHVAGLGGRVDDVVDRLHGEVPGHELDDRPQARHRGADAEAGEAVLGDRRVDHALGRRTPPAGPG